MAETSERTWTVDSVEEGVAAVHEEGAGLRRVPLWLLPSAAREGDMLRVAREEDGPAGEAVTLRVRLDRAATAAALRRSEERLARLRRDDPGGDIVL